MMDHPIPPSPCDRPAKRQCRVSQDPENENKLQSHPQQYSNGLIIECGVPVRTTGSLTAEFIKLLHHNDALATPALKLLDLHFCLWECYVVKSSEKVRIEEEQRQLQASNEWLASDSDILLQLCNEQALILWDRKKQFEHFVTASFQPCKQAIPKPSMLMGRGEVSALSTPRGR